MASSDYRLQIITPAGWVMRINDTFLAIVLLGDISFITYLALDAAR
jgi:hypothetical protein